MNTGGDDNLLKIWDYEVQKNVPFFYESFIGHINPVSRVLFNPTDNNMAFSIGDTDGIYIWAFNGDINSNFHPPLEESDIQAKAGISTEAATVLERMRQQIKDKKTIRPAEGNFTVSQFESADSVEK